MEKKECLKILLVSPIPPPVGGIARWTEQYICWAKTNKLNVDVVNTALIGKRLKKINDKRNLVDEIKRTKKIIENLKYKISKFKPNIVHLNSACGSFGLIRDYICAKIIKKNNIRLIVHYRCDIESQIGKNIIKNKFFCKISRLADLNFVLNKSSKQMLLDRSKQKSILVSNFIDEKNILEKRKDIRNEIKIVSFVGHVQRKKGIFEIIEVAIKNPEIEFKLAGPVSRELQNIKKPLNLHFMGSLNKKEVLQLLDESDLFLFPSYTEGFANALLEAMARGIPIIATDVGANKDMLENKGGKIIRGNKTKEISDYIEILKSREIRMEMSNWNINKVKENYTIEKVMEKFIENYLECI